MIGGLASSDFVIERMARGEELVEAKLKHLPIPQDEAGIDSNVEGKRLRITVNR